MKFAIAFIVVVWLICGVVGAWMVDELDLEHWKTIARGPITLVNAEKDNPVTIPGAPG